MQYRGVTLRYEVDRARLTPALAQAFVGMDADASTRAFIDDCIANPCSAMSMTARRLAAKVMSDYDANGLLGTHDMRVLGTHQWQRLVGRERLGGALLDVGAGDGQVTEALAPLVDTVVTTELSSQMAKRLRKRGYECHEVDLAAAPLSAPAAPTGMGPFDVIALLNVIDRTDRPLTLLERLRNLATEEAWLFVAAPLPLAPHVHVGPATVDPDERLPIERASYEAAAVALAELALAPSGWQVTAWTRVPYLCRGGPKQPATHLDDAVFACRPTTPAPRILG